MLGPVGPRYSGLGVMWTGEFRSDDAIEGAVDERTANRHDSAQVARRFQLAGQSESVGRLLVEQAEDRPLVQRQCGQHGHNDSLTETIHIEWRG